MGDVTREARTGLPQDVTRAGSSDDIGDDVVMREDNADENRSEHLSASGSDSRRRITTKREPREVRDAESSVTKQHVPRNISDKTTLLEQPVAVTTQEALPGFRGKTVRVAKVENNTLNWVSISSAGALDMTHCGDTSLEAVSQMSSFDLTKIRTGVHEEGQRSHGTHV